MGQSFSWTGGLIAIAPGKVEAAREALLAAQDGGTLTRIAWYADKHASIDELLAEYGHAAQGEGYDAVVASELQEWHDSLSEFWDVLAPYVRAGSHIDYIVEQDPYRAYFDGERFYDLCGRAYYQLPARYIAPGHEGEAIDDPEGWDDWQGEK